MAGEFAEDAKGWWKAHGILMILAWGVCLPLGALLPVYRRLVGKTILRNEPSFYPWHRNLQWLGIILTMVALACAAKGSRNVYDTGRPFDDTLLNFTADDIAWNRHVKWGISVIILSSVQVILGVWHHILKARHDANAEQQQPWKRAFVPSWAHVVLGTVCTLAAYITQYQGLQIYNYIFAGPDTIKGGIKFGYFVVTFSAFVFVALYGYEKLYGMHRAAANNNNNNSNHNHEPHKTNQGEELTEEPAGDAA